MNKLLIISKTHKYPRSNIKYLIRIEADSQRREATDSLLNYTFDRKSLRLFLLAYIDAKYHTTELPGLVELIDNRTKNHNKDDTFYIRTWSQVDWVVLHDGNMTCWFEICQNVK